MSAYRPISLEPDAARSRRALLATALAGIGALAATAIGGVTPRRVRAGIGDPLLAGSTVGAAGATSGVTNNSDTNGTWVVTQNGKGTAIRGQSDHGTAGRFTTGARNKSALVATNSAGPHGAGNAISADGGSQIGIQATSAGSYAIYAQSAGNSGVYGESETGDGLTGYSDSGFGVHAQANGGTGLYATSVSGYAAQMAGSAKIDKFMDFLEMTDPGGGASLARVYARDNGGKTELCVVFDGGSITVLASQP